MSKLIQCGRKTNSNSFVLQKSLFAPIMVYTAVYVINENHFYEVAYDLCYRYKIGTFWRHLQNTTGLFECPFYWNSFCSWGWSLLVLTVNDLSFVISILEGFVNLSACISERSSYCKILYLSSDLYDLFN